MNGKNFEKENKLVNLQRIGEFHEIFPVVAEISSDIPQICTMFVPPGIAFNCYDVTVSIYRILIFTARCTSVQSAVLRSHVVCLSVCLSVCNVGEL